MGASARTVRAALLACAVTLAACTTDHDDSQRSAGATTTVSSGVGDAEPKHDRQYCPTCPPPPPPVPPSVPTTGVRPPSTRDPRETPKPDPIAVNEIHIERHQGFDRVVFGFGGIGIPGWQADYVGQATPRGRPLALLVAGKSILRLSFYSVAPWEAGLRGYDGPNPLGDPAAQQVGEVHLAPTYGEGADRITEAFIGTRSAQPRFTVTRLSDPLRLAVDIYA